jgi:hypothetical protein
MFDAGSRRVKPGRMIVERRVAGVAGRLIAPPFPLSHL